MSTPDQNQEIDSNDNTPSASKFRNDKDGLLGSMRKDDGDLLSPTKSLYREQDGYRFKEIKINELKKEENK